MIRIDKGNNINTALIYKHMNKNNMCKTKFCKECKISPSTFNKIIAGNKDFSIMSLFKISVTIGVQMRDMLE